MSVSAFSPGDLIQEVRDTNIDIKDPPIIVVPTSTPTPTISYKIKLPIKVFDTNSATPTVVPTAQPTQTSIPTPAESQVTPTITSTASPVISPNETDESAVDGTEVSEQPPAEPKEDGSFDIKEIVGIALVTLLVLVIVFQSRKGNKSEPQSP